MSKNIEGPFLSCGLMNTDRMSNLHKAVPCLDIVVTCTVLYHLLIDCFFVSGTGSSNPDPGVRQGDILVQQ